MKLVNISCLFISIILVGCGVMAKSSGVIEIAPDTHRLIARAQFRSNVESQKMAFQEANAFCDSLGKKMSIVKDREIQKLIDGTSRFDGYEVTFKCEK